MIPATVVASIVIGAIHIGFTWAKNRRIGRVVDFAPRTPEGEELRDKARLELWGARTEMIVLAVGYPLLTAAFWIVIVLQNVG